ncbi:PEP-CTERM sorting domain-containing protein [uncultured Massilia sp.]|uniref:PEP-CTERM sorting domain-containing protein n=1 Tax=uncultured Massilia sp. TaxID=169973 RepID=UPI002587E590|nr:PEP-CTERM sorting domain-containing protein [uncultured Massilia sp.]
MRIRSILSCLSVLAIITANTAGAVPLVVNGNFELMTNGGNKQLSSKPLNVANRTTLVGWTSSNGNDGGYNFVLDTGLITTGASAIALKKYESGVSHGNVFASDALYYPGVLSQSITGLTPGASYLLSFDYALGQQSGFNGPNLNNFWHVGFGKAVQDSKKLSIENGGFSGWQTATMKFTAESADQVLSFLALSNSPGAPPFMLLDNVDLRADVPEPSTVSMMMLGGFGLLGFMARRRKATAQ